MASTVGKVQEIVVGDLNNDRYDDALLVGSEGSQLLKFATNGFITDGSALGGIRALKGTDATLGDIDITGKLALLAVTPEGRLRAFTNYGTAIFRERKPSPGDGFDITGVTSVTIEDWNNDDLPDAAHAQGRAALDPVQSTSGGLVGHGSAHGLASGSMPGRR